MNEMYEIIADYVEENSDKVRDMIERMFSSACDVRLEAKYDVATKEVEICIHEGDWEYAWEYTNDVEIVTLLKLNQIVIKENIEEVNDNGGDITPLIDDYWDILDGELTNLMNQ